MHDVILPNGWCWCWIPTLEGILAIYFTLEIHAHGERGRERALGIACMRSVGLWPISTLGGLHSFLQLLLDT